MDEQEISFDEGVYYTTAVQTNALLASMKTLFPKYSKDNLFSFILCGNVQVDGETEKNHTKTIQKGSVISLKDPERIDARINIESFVSRGAQKMYPVLDELRIDVAGMIWLDCGCAAGGFTQCLLASQAAGVHAVDVAYNTLDYILRIDSRVVVHEKTNIMSITQLDPLPQRAVVDLSFRSLRGAAAHILSICEHGYALALCKPQFEYATYQKNRSNNFQSAHGGVKKFDGVLEDHGLIADILFAVVCDLYEEQVMVNRIIPAGIKGMQGNQEYFLELVDMSEKYNKNALGDIPIAPALIAQSKETVFGHYKCKVEESMNRK